MGNCVEYCKGKKIISATKNSSSVKAVVVGSSPTRLRNRSVAQLVRARMKKSNLVPNIEGSSDLNRAYKRLFQQINQKLSVKQRVWVRIPACPNRGVGVWCNGSIKKVNLDAQIWR